MIPLAWAELPDGGEVSAGAWRLQNLALRSEEQAQV